MKTIAIIWAGAAWLMTAATILENTENQKYHIHIFEKNKTPGNKVIISWGGRCNVTTGITDKKILASKYTRGWEFIGKRWVGHKKSMTGSSRMASHSRCRRICEYFLYQMMDMISWKCSNAYSQNIAIEWRCTTVKVSLMFLFLTKRQKHKNTKSPHQNDPTPQILLLWRQAEVPIVILVLLVMDMRLHVHSDIRSRHLGHRSRASSRGRSGHMSSLGWVSRMQG